MLPVMCVIYIVHVYNCAYAVGEPAGYIYAMYVLYVTVQCINNPYATKVEFSV